MNPIIVRRRYPGRDVLIQKVIGNSDSIKVSKNVFLTLQYFVEQHIVSLLHKAYLAAIHTGRVKLTVSDIEFIRSLNITNTEDDPVKTLNMDDSSLPRDIKEEFEEIDSNNDGKISITEFKDWKDKQIDRREGEAARKTMNRVC